jgi:medium-chain acyl-[acyl-carrier-protein] hydrolase
MGALISFELARELRRRREAGPIAIFVSGRPAPQLPDAERITYNLPEQEFLDELRRLNGTPRELLDSPELRELFVPTIRADFQVVETYTYTADEPLSCAVYAYGGLQDGSVPAEKLRGWQAQTSGPSKVRMFPGDHFYIHSSGDLVHMLHRDVLDLLVHGKIDLRTAAPKIRR